ncbi:MAG: PTS sugar transporter subunit IIB [Planctomycetia bacterium]|nr:PTS sugar transporter subunit IIB [Planctomycetia bacterium]
MKILAICGMGMGSSMILKMQIEKIIQEWEIPDVMVEHSDITTANSSTADYYVVAQDLAPAIHREPKIVVQSILNQAELKEKLSVFRTDTP